MNYRASQLLKAFRDFLDKNWLILFLLLYIVNSSNQMPMERASFGMPPMLEETEATEISYWGDVDNVAQGYSLKNPKKTNRYANIAFLINKGLQFRDDVTPEMISQNNEICTNYVRRYSSVARKEMEKFGIPASITLAQGLLESDAGGSRLSRKNNNHFGMKCFSRKCKKGHCSNFTDDSHKDFFRIYKSVWESYRAHSKLLMGKRYKPLQKYGKDYKKWAHGLRKAGYATDKNYAPKLIAIIEALHLDEFDK